MHKRVKIALAGNPNSGKTTIFNRLTGARQHVANYPGVTVEIKRGVISAGDYEVELVDLPGTYSLTAFSAEELSARSFLINEKPDAVIDVVDASTLERQLYLTIQLLELGLPVVLALNMSDMAERRGLRFNLPLLSQLLGIPIIETVGTTGSGVDRLMEAALNVAAASAGGGPRFFSYGRVLDAEIAAIQAEIDRLGVSEKLGLPSKWLAIKLLEEDEEVVRKLREAGIMTESLTKAIQTGRSRLTARFGDSPEVLLAEARYGVISGAASEAVTRTVEARHDFSDSLDSLLLSPVFGIPIFLAAMYLVFSLTFRLGNPLSELLGQGFLWLSEGITAVWPGGDSSPLCSLITDGIVAGVGGVVSFLPNIMFLFLAIAFLEDSGYMARAAFIMDRAMHTMGLHGKSFIPMLIGFGCTVPAIIGTRILENRRDRIVTILILPLMSCSARLPVYSLIIPAFFPIQLQAPMLWVVYVIGIGLAVFLTRLLRVTAFRGDSTPFIMELPPYRVPTVQGLLIHAWERGAGYLRKAGTIIVAVTILLWWGSSYPKTETTGADGLNSSYIGTVAQAMEPVLRTMGFDWRIGTALIGAVAAKEVFVAQLGVVYSVDERSSESRTLAEKLRENYTPLVGFCVMLFMLVAMPCVATVATTRAETGSWWWAGLQWGGLTLLGWVLTTLVFQIGSLTGLGVP